MGPSRLALSLALLVPLTSEAAAETWHVGPGQSIQAAIDSAEPGDVLLVAPGSYASFVLDRPLSVIAEGPGVTVGPVSCPVFLPGCEFLPSAEVGITVTGIPHGSEAVLAGLSVRSISAYAMVLEQNPGTVVLADVVVYDWSVPYYSALSVQDSKRVLLVGCNLTGHTKVDIPSSPYSAGYSAVRAVSSRLWISDSDLRGGDGNVWGGSFSPGSQSGGGHGLYLAASEALVTRSSFVGGAGGTDFVFPFPFSHYAGGDGIHATAGSLLGISGGPGTSLDGGFSGGSDFGNGVDVRSGSIAIVSDSASLSSPGGESHWTASDATSALVSSAQPFPTLGVEDATVALGDVVGLQVHGATDAFAVLATSPTLGPETLLPGFNGVGELDLETAWILAVLPLGAEGAASLQVPVPQASALAGIRFALQAVQVGGFDAISNPVVVVLY